MKPVYLTNRKVAWEIPAGRIATRYLDRVYLTVGDWEVIVGKLPNPPWFATKVGFFRNEETRSRAVGKSLN